VILVGLCIGLVRGRVTRQTMRNLTGTTEELRERIVGVGLGVGLGEGVDGLRGGVHVGMGQGQSVFGAERVVDGRQSEGEGDGEEVESTVVAALRILCSDLLIELEKPLDSTTNLPVSPELCPTISKEYHSFIEATVKFLYEIQERQMIWQWSAQSGVFDGVSWLQALWASRKTNTQERSFIEQQLALYSSTGCFGKSKEVLRRDVEVVEFMNDLIDRFQ